MPRTNPEPPDLTTIAGRLRWARLEKGFASPRAAAQFFEWNENTYKSHEFGIRASAGLKTQTAKKYGRAFGVSAEWLLTGAGGPFDKRPKSEADTKWENMTEEERTLAMRLLRAAQG